MYRSHRALVRAQNRSMKIGLALVALIAIVQTTMHLVSVGPVPRDGIGPILDAYRSVAHLLPPHGSVGFVDTSQDADFNTLSYYLAQQALAPRIVSRDISADTAIVITPT